MKHFKVSKYSRITSIMLAGDVQAILKEVKTRERLKYVNEAFAHIARKYAEQEGIEVPGRGDPNRPELTCICEQAPSLRASRRGRDCSQLESAKSG